ncbi:MAG: WxL domain-containing protein [Bifidobacteriaceae bacterium]|jgi:hypothetical protein|nr:WxL domain-containing protein [Bifidobacteriaceae bacterium]
MTPALSLRRGAALLAAGALGLAGAAVFAEAAVAADVAVEDVTLAWSINDESGGGAYYGGCNFLSAGVAGNAGSAKVWTEADGLWTAQDGDVSIEKPTASGVWEAPTWATKCQNAAGQAVTTAAGSTTGNRVVFADGAGVVDLDSGTATVEWEGGFTVVFYGGMTYWSASDPVLTVNADGTGQLTATASGYKASMADPTLWEELTPQAIVLADFQGITLSETGFTLAPEYRGVAVTGVTQSQTGADWGSFPQSFVDFQLLTGQSSYWYSSGTGGDAKKPAQPVAVAWSIASPPPPLNPQVTVSRSELSADGVTTITVEGTGFDPTAVTGLYPPLAGKSSGVYVGFGRFADTWRPSAGASSSSRPTALVRWAVLAEFQATVGGAANGAIVLEADGSFTATFEVSKAAADAAADAKGLVGGNYGIYTYPGGGAAQPAFETYTPLTFTPGLPIDVEIPETTGPPQPGEFSWRVAGNAAVSLGTATETADGFAANGALPNIEVTDTRVTQAEWSLSGQASSFTGTAGSFGGEYLGWTPVVANAGAGAQAGAAVAPNASGGLGTAKTLAFAQTGHALGTATVAAALELKAPASTPAGNYTSLLTITAVG